MFDTCFRKLVLSVFTHTHVSENMWFDGLHIIEHTVLFLHGFVHIFWHVWHMFQKTCDFIATCFREHVLLLGFCAHYWRHAWCYIGFYTFNHGFHIFRKLLFLFRFCAHDWQHVWFCIGFCTCCAIVDAFSRQHVILLGLCARYWQHVQFYINCHTFSDNVCNFALVFTHFAMVFHILGNISFYMGFVHMIDNMCTFALVSHIFWHVFAFFTTVGFSARLSENNWFYLSFVHMIDNMCNFALVSHMLCHFCSCFKEHVMLLGFCARYWQHVQLYNGFTCSTHFHMFTTPAVLLGLLSLVITICVSGSGLHRLPDVLARVAVWIDFPQVKINSRKLKLTSPS